MPHETITDADFRRLTKGALAGQIPALRGRGLSQGAFGRGGAAHALPR